MKLLSQKNSGFTLIELMVSIAILGIVSVGVSQMYANVLYAWNSGNVKMKLSGESRIAMLLIKKLIHSCQGSTIVISRFNSNQPANSYFGAVAGETIYATSTQQNCGCGTSSDSMTVGTKGEYVTIYQNGNYLVAKTPKLTGAVDWDDPDSIQSHVSYNYVTISSNLDNISFVMGDSTRGSVVHIAARFSKHYYRNRPPAEIMLKEAVVVKHPYSSGFYAN
ncbi:MAG TPA: prepilin-type N-terminal cleavage/methylation domain-containing protein [Candidatus Goldiibacteriota bacterium]|nr:prepilin-type N-terminal cleavage/methylation domain-containing protein [Candidatus Goldiibacteriota bacterium]